MATDMARLRSERRNRLLPVEGSWSFRERDAAS